MKALIFSFAMILSVSTLFAQERSKVAVGPTKTEITAGKQSGEFTFVMPAGFTADEVAQNSKYYTHYFTVVFDAKTSKAKLTMVTNDEKGRSVITRFLVANGVQEVNIDGTLVNMADLFEKYLK
jgi:hypothetical protein